nr:hypothetical protein [uncultured Schaedlerella sp.]
MDGRELLCICRRGAGYAFEGNDDGGQDDDGSITGKKVEVQLSDIRRLGIVTLGAMKQYDRIEKFLNFLKSWYLCYFSPDAARRLQNAAPQAYFLPIICCCMKKIRGSSYL